jgi:hypothetical protein
VHGQRRNRNQPEVSRTRNLHWVKSSLLLLLPTLPASGLRLSVGTLGGTPTSCNLGTSGVGQACTILPAKVKVLKLGLLVTVLNQERVSLISTFIARDNTEMKATRVKVSKDEM